MDGKVPVDLLDQLYGTQKSVLHIPTIDDESGLEGISGIELYGPRQIAMARVHDGFIIAQSVRTAVMEKLRILQALGIPTIDAQNIAFIEYDPTQKTLSEAALRNREAIVKVLQRTQPRHLVPFFQSSRSDTLAKEHSLMLPTTSHSTVEAVNDKWLSQEAWQSLGLPTCNGKLATNLDEAAEILRSLTKYKAVCIKVRRSVSGQGVSKVSRQQALEYLRAKHTELLHHGVIIEPWFEDINPTTGFPSVQVYIANQPADDMVIAASYQIVKDNVHKGNFAAPKLLETPGLTAHLSTFSTWARNKGFRGIAGIDFIDAEGELRFSDPNMRQTGVTSAVLLVHKITGSINTTPWTVNNNIATAAGLSPEDAVKILSTHNLLFNPQAKHGIVPTNLATLPHQKVMLLAIGASQEHANALMTQAAKKFQLAT